MKSFRSATFLSDGKTYLNCLVVGKSPTPLKNDGVSSSVGMMTFHDIPIWKVMSSSHVPVTTNQFKSKQNMLSSDFLLSWWWFQLKLIWMINGWENHYFHEQEDI